MCNVSRRMANIAATRAIGSVFVEPLITIRSFLVHRCYNRFIARIEGEASSN